MRYVLRRAWTRFFVSLFDWSGYLLFRLAPRVRPSSRFRRILIIRLDHIGDILFTTPLPKVLKDSFGDCHITILTTNAGARLFESNPYVDQVIAYDPPWFRRGRPSQPKEGFWGMPHRIKRERFDLALCLRGDLRENLLAWLAGIPRRVGYGITGGGFFLTDCVEYHATRHERHHTTELLKRLGISPPEMRPALYFSDEEERRYALRLSDWGIPRHQELVAVQLQAGTQAKQWPKENALAFMELCAGKFPRQTLVFVGDDEKSFEWVNEFLRRNPEVGWVNLQGRTSLREMLWLTRRCRLFIGHDSGPSHVAASYGIPTLFLYSGTNAFELWRSLEDSAEFLRNPVRCSPCHRTVCVVPGHPCMAQIEAQEVFHWLEDRSRASA